MWDFKVKILYEAYKDLEEYWDYIERMTFSREKADEELWKILWEILKLNFMPYMFPKTYMDYHSFSYRNKRIFYEIDDSNKKVIVFHILWWYQKFENILD